MAKKLETVPLLKNKLLNRAKYLIKSSTNLSYYFNKPWIILHVLVTILLHSLLNILLFFIKYFLNQGTDLVSCVLIVIFQIY